MSGFEIVLILALAGSMILNAVSMTLYGKTVKRTIKKRIDDENEIARLNFLLSLKGESNERD